MRFISEVLNGLCTGKSNQNTHLVLEGIVSSSNVLVMKEASGISLGEILSSSSPWGSVSWVSGLSGLSDGRAVTDTFKGAGGA